MALQQKKDSKCKKITSQAQWGLVHLGHKCSSKFCTTKLTQKGHELEYFLSGVWFTNRFWFFLFKIWITKTSDYFIKEFVKTCSTNKRTWQLGVHLKVPIIVSRLLHIDSDFVRHIAGWRCWDGLADCKSHLSPKVHTFQNWDLQI